MILTQHYVFSKATSTFSRLYFVQWRVVYYSIICGLTQFSTKAHIARACLEATCFQTREVRIRVYACQRLSSIYYVGCSVTSVITCCVCCVCGQLLDAMNQDSGISLKSLQVDGGMTANNLLMQLQADITGLTIGKFIIGTELCVFCFSIVSFLNDYLL